jgi:SAM-dependent methyltransferase
VADRHRRRATFEEVPELYDRARPGYPAELFDDLVELADLRAGSRLLEIGCGTGQATVPLAERGVEIVCVELGAGLAAVARRSLARFSGVELFHAAFEDWEPEPRAEPFDAAVSFTAFHWIDPEVRYAKAARLLRRGGALAVVETKHVVPEGSDAFWVEVQEDYDAVLPSAENRPPGRPEDVGDLRGEFAESGAFGEVVVRRYLADIAYSAEEYLAVLDTYSGHRTMEPEACERLYERIRRRIEALPEPKVTKTYLFTLNLARKL